MILLDQQQSHFMHSSQFSLNRIEEHFYYKANKLSIKTGFSQAFQHGQR